MKDSRKYAQRIHRLFRSLKQAQAKVKQPEYDEPLQAVIYGIISEHTTAGQAESIVKRLQSHFVDTNDMRVARKEEVLEVLGENSQQSRATADVLKQVLNAVFNKYDLVNLSVLKEIGKKQAAGVLEKIEGVSKFARDYCILTALSGHAMPLTEKMLEYLRADELVDPEADCRQICGFLERQISASDSYQFYHLFREISEKGTKAADVTIRKRPAKPKTAAKRKTAGKKTTKK